MDLPPDIQKILERTGIKLEDAIAYVEEHYGAEMPNARNNPAFCVRLYLSHKGISEADVLAENYSKIATMKDGKKYKIQVLVANETRSWTYTGCSVCGHRLNGDTGENAVCDSKSCNGATRVLKEYQMGEYWAGDSTGSVKLIIRKDKIRDGSLANSVAVVDGMFRQTKEPVFFVDAVNKKRGGGAERPLASTQVAQPVPAPEKVNNMKVRIQRYFALFGGHVEEPKFEKWFSEEFPGVDYNDILKQLPITKGSDGKMAWNAGK